MSDYKMIDRMIYNFKLFFPSIDKMATDYQIDNSDCLNVKLNDGYTMLYDDFDHTIRTLPKNSNKMTEIEFRREFSKRLRRRMTLKGVTQKDLSEMTGISEITISKYLNYKGTPSFYNTDKIAKALKCSMEYFRYTY